MAEARPISRRALILGALAFPGIAFAAQGGRKVVTVLGDSITAGLGLPAALALPAQLQIALQGLHNTALVRAAGVSGDTTAGGLARVGFSVQKDTDLCVIALGGNDVLQGVDVAVTKANLAGILDKLKARHIKALLVGLAAPGDLGGAYGREFSAIFPALAKEKHVAVYPNLLEGVALNTNLNQGDGIHPNAEGVLVIARRLAPVVAKALR